MHFRVRTVHPNFRVSACSVKILISVSEPILCPLRIDQKWLDRLRANRLKLTYRYIFMKVQSNDSAITVTSNADCASCFKYCVIKATNASESETMKCEIPSNCSYLVGRVSSFTSTHVFQFSQASNQGFH